MIGINKILWTTDGSKEARAALNYAKLFANAFNSEIIGLHVIKVIDKKVGALFGERIDLTGWVEDAAGKWFDTFDGVREELKGENLKFTYKVVAGSPHEKIIEVANEGKADLIVMGKRGLGLKDRALVGSNTIKVLKGSQIPVLAVRARTGKSKIKRIIVPFDVSDKFDSALKYAVSLSEAFDSIISIVYVLELISYPYEFPVSVLEDMRGVYDNELKKKIAEISSQLGGKIKIKHRVVESINPYLGIIEFAQNERADLIVMNTHGRKGIKRIVLGSVAEKVIQESPCSVLALKPVS
jgi:nucleotide-binding universal stress UspA family protein